MKKHYKWVIERVFERGTDEEKKEILRFYGTNKIKAITGSGEISGKSLGLMRNSRYK